MNKPTIIVVGWSLLIGTLLMTSLTVTAHANATERSAPTAPLQSLRELSASVPTTRSPTIKAWKLRQGTKVLFVENHTLPMFDIRINFAAGSNQDGNSPGLAAMVLSLFNEGTESKDANTLAKDYDRLGVALGNGINREQSHFTLRSLSAPAVREPAMQLFTEMLSRPGFTAAGQRRVHHELLTQITNEQDQPHAVALTLLYNELYPEQPFSRSVYGSVQGIEQISDTQLRAFYRRAYTAANAQMVIVGDITQQQAQVLSQSLADALPQGPALSFPQPLGESKIIGRTQHLEEQASHTLIMLAQNAPPHQHPDTVAVRAGNVIFSHILNAYLREKHSVTYGVLSEIPHAQGTSPWIIALNTPSRYSASALAQIKTLFTRFLEQGPTEAELNDIKQYLLRALPQLTASNLEMRNELSLINRFNQPLSFNYKTEQIQSMTREQIQTAMNRHFSTAGWASVTVGPTVAQLPLPEMMEPGVMEAHTCRPTNWAAPGQHTKFGRRPLLWQLIHNAAPPSR